MSVPRDERAAIGVEGLDRILISGETRELFVREIEVPTSNVFAIFHNILFVRHVEVGAELQRLLTAVGSALIDGHGARPEARARPKRKK